MKKKNILKLFILVVLLVFLGSSGMLLCYYLEYREGDVEYEALKAQAVRKKKLDEQLGGR